MLQWCPMRHRLPLFVIFLASLCGAATLQILNLDEMTANSTAIVQGRIVSTRSDWSDSQNNSIVTIYTIQAGRYLKGNLGVTFEIAEPGGRMGNLVITAAGG